jgi:predicted Zn-dependent protease
MGRFRLVFLCWVAGALLAASGVSMAAVPVKKAPVRSTTSVHKPVAGKAPIRTTTKAPVKPIAGVAKPAIANPNAFIASYNQGRQAFEAQQYPAAEKFIQQSLSLALKVPNQPPKNLATIYQFLGAIQFKQGKYAAVLNSLNHANAIYETPALKSASQETLAGNYMTLGTVAILEARYPEAKQYFQKGIPLGEAQWGANHPQVLEAREHLAAVQQVDLGPDYLAAVSATPTRWSHPDQPVTIYIQDGSALADWRPGNVELVKAAFGEWQAALETRLQFALVSDPEQADIVVSWMNMPSPESKEGHSEMRNGLCTTQSVNNELLVRDDIEIALHNTDGSVFDDTVLYNALLHEVAHSIGMLHGHSTNPSDVLYHSNRYDGGRRKHLTTRDINTARRLYAMTPQITNPAGIHLMAYHRFVNLRVEAAQAYNAQQYEKALLGFRQALGLYNADLDARFWLGMTHWQLKQYENALPYFSSTATTSWKHQGEAFRMAGISLIQSGGLDDQAGAHALAEDKYRRAQQYLNQGLTGRIALSADDAKSVQDQLGWLNQRLAISQNVIQWNGAAQPTQTASNSATESTEASGKKKKRWWAFEPTPYTNRVPVQIMIPGGMHGY